MTEVAVIVPYRETSELRASLVALVLDFYADQFPNWPVLLADDGGDTFSRGASINAAAARTDAQVLVFNDADTLPASTVQVVDAVLDAKTAPGIVYAYTTYVRLDKTGENVEWAQQFTPSHGCSAIQRACFLEAGGYDERFRGWGYEDSELTARLSGLWPVRRQPGNLFHFWHGDRRPDDSPVSESPVWVASNSRLLEALSGQ